MKKFFFLLAAATFALIACDDSTSANNSRNESTVVDTVLVKDTIRVVDTLSFCDTVNVRDTVKVQDTVRVRDTLNVYDTIPLHDTLSLVDTIIKYKDSCVVQENEDKSVTVTCGGKSQILYVALCDGRTYDANTQACIDDKIYELCGDVTYDKKEKLCENGKLFPYFVDSRDNQVYKTVTIGKQTWMAENLNIRVDSSWCGGGAQKSYEEGDCNVYGRLYSWATAMNLDEKYNEEKAGELIQKPHRGLCPFGWHIPTMEEWRTLYNVVMAANPDVPYDEQMKADSLWENERTPDASAVGDGLNITGFNVLPAGRRIYSKPTHAASTYNGQFTEVTKSTTLICASEFSADSYNEQSFYAYKMNGYGYVVSNPSNGSGKSWAGSVRCLKNEE